MDISIDIGGAIAILVVIASIAGFLIRLYILITGNKSTNDKQENTIDDLVEKDRNNEKIIEKLQDQVKGLLKEKEKDDAEIEKLKDRVNKTEGRQEIHNEQFKTITGSLKRIEGLIMSLQENKKDKHD